MKTIIVLGDDQLVHRYWVSVDFIHTLGHRVTLPDRCTPSYHVILAGLIVEPERSVTCLHCLSEE